MAELSEEIDGIGPATEDKLNALGIETVSDLADASVDDLEERFSESKAEKIIDRASQKAVVFKSGTEIEKEEEERTFVSTGVRELDDVLDGGWESESVGCIYGPPGVGKTQFIFQAVATVDGRSVVIDTEDSFRSSRVKQIADETDVLDRIDVVQVDSIDAQEASYKAVQDQLGEVDFVAIDSFTFLFRTSDRFEDRSDLSSRTSVMGTHLKQLRRLAKSKSCPVVLIGQVYGNPTRRGESHRLWGGDLMKHSVDYFLKLRPTGNITKTVLESHPGLPVEEVLINITSEGLVGVEE